MSEDLIRRSDAIEAIELVDWYHQNRNKDIVSGANSREHQAWYKAEDIYKALEAVPSADRPQGKWIRISSLYSLDRTYRCSVCGKVIDDMPMDEYYDPAYKGCPYCFTRMKGADDE